MAKRFDLSDVFFAVLGVISAALIVIAINNARPKIDDKFFDQVFAQCEKYPAQCPGYTPKRQR